jgi:hypothetical protein
LQIQDEIIGIILILGGNKAEGVIDDGVKQSDQRDNATIVAAISSTYIMAPPSWRRWTRWLTLGPCG